ncbi:MAG: hypothetical protein H0Z29_03760 [Candidatus Marinimicrobia bacterium]|nr:hypothetical protein [Candidatus Neomarinimicrobiota bacterium]
MTTKVNSGKKSSGRPYDAHSAEDCPECSGKVVYRRSSYFGNKIYYKVCNNCGWYKVMDRDSWMEAVFTKAEKTEEKIKEKKEEPEPDSETAKVDEIESSKTSKIEEEPAKEKEEKPKRDRGGYKSSKAKEENSE